jgi:hypothetical protein
MSPPEADECTACRLSIDTRVTTSSLRLKRDVGSIGPNECLQYGYDIQRVKGGELSFRDFFDKLQNGDYWQPSKTAPDGSMGFCAQIKFPDAVAATVTDFASFEAKKAQLETLRIRQVGAGFSGGTKAKFVLSLPVTFEYTTRTLRASTPTTRWTFFSMFKMWLPITVPGPMTSVPVTEKVEVKTITLFHPCPVRINNVQYDAVMTFNDPADKPGAVIMVPLRGTNANGVEERFFNKIVKFLTTVGTPDPVTGLYQESNVSVGNDWNLKNVFILDEPATPSETTTNPSPLSAILNSLYSWDSANSYERYLKLVNGTDPNTAGNKALLQNLAKGVQPASPATLTYGWRTASGTTTKYLLVGSPVGISQTDLGILLRNLPPTPVEEAIHPISTTQKVNYKPPTGRAVGYECGGGRERMTNPGDDVLASVFASGSATDLLTDTQASIQELSDEAKCDPFALNARLTSTKMFTPQAAITFVINFLLIVAFVFGIWVAMYLITKDYDYSYQDFAEKAGKVIGVFARQTSGTASATAYSASQASVRMPTVADLTRPFRKAASAVSQPPPQ